MPGLTASKGHLRQTGVGSAPNGIGYSPVLGRYLIERGPVFVRISKREFVGGEWRNRLRGCQAVGLMRSEYGIIAEMAVASAIVSATRARKVVEGAARFHKPVWSDEIGSLSIFLYVISEMIPTNATTEAELQAEGHNVIDYGLIGISHDRRYRGAICGNLNAICTIDDQIRAVCRKAQNVSEIRTHDRLQMRFVRMHGRWLWDPQRPMATYF